MDFITGKHITRRAMLKGMGASIGLPMLDAMVPASKPLSATEAGRSVESTRLVAIENVHGAAGCNDLGASLGLWSPTEEGKDFDLSLSSMNPLDPWRKYLTIISDTDSRMADAFSPAEIGGDHFRTAAVFLTQAHPKQTQGSDVFAGPSFDQVYAQHIAGETQRGLYALKHGDEEDLGLALMSLKRISFEAAQQFQEMCRHSKPVRRIHTHSASPPKAHYKHS